MGLRARPVLLVPPVPLGAGLNSYDKLLVTAGASHAMTVGFLTLSDANNSTGGGCTGIVLTVPGGTLVGNGGPGWSFWTTDDAGGGTGQTSSGQGLRLPGDITAGTVAITSGIQNNLFSAVVNDGSSMITGIVSDSTVVNTGHSPNACRDWGGFAGSY